jgi:anti-sigma28 factor (negative regulator of flagellin synthesis)
MSDIHFFSRNSGLHGTAAVRALDKTSGTHNEQQRSREERIAELKRQYESGTYVVDSVQLSSALVNEVLKER